MNRYLLLLALCACNGDDDVIDTDPEGTDADSETDSESDTETDSETDTEAQVATASVRFIHGSSDAGPISVMGADGALFSDVSFGQTGMATLDADSGPWTVLVDGESVTSLDPSFTSDSYTLVLGGSLAAATDASTDNDHRALSLSLVANRDDAVLVGDLATAGAGWDVALGDDTATLPIGDAVALGDGDLLQLLNPDDQSVVRRFSLTDQLDVGWQAWVTGSAGEGVEVMLVSPSGGVSVQAGDARVRFLSALTLGESVTFDLSLAGESSPFATNIGYLEPTDWTFLPSGSITLEARNHGASGPPAMTMNVIIPESGGVTVVGYVTPTGDIEYFTTFQDGAAPDTIEVRGHLPGTALQEIRVTDRGGAMTQVSGQVENGLSPFGVMPSWGGRMALVSGNLSLATFVDIPGEFAGQRVLVIPDIFTDDVLLLGSDSLVWTERIEDDSEVIFVNIADHHVAFQANQGYRIEHRGTGPSIAGSGPNLATNFMPGQVSGPHTYERGQNWWWVYDNQQGHSYSGGSAMGFPGFRVAVIQRGQLGYDEYAVRLPLSSRPIPADEIGVTFATLGYPNSQMGLQGPCVSGTSMNTDRRALNLAETVDPTEADLVFHDGTDTWRWDITGLTPGKHWLLAASADNAHSLVAWTEDEATQEIPATLVQPSECSQ